MERCLLTLAFCVLGGCWTEEPLIHGAFTAEQWAHLKDEFTLKDDPKPCQGRCVDEAKFGQQLFFEPALSGPWVTDAKGVKLYPVGKTSCSTCHDAATGWYVDVRPGATSIGAAGPDKPTAHNTISLVNVMAKTSLYTWTGECADPVTKVVRDCVSPRDVVHNIALPGAKAMASDQEILARVINNVPAYRNAYKQLFPSDYDSYQVNVEQVLDSYMTMLVSRNAPFDRFIAGDDDAISESAKRGFGLFVGKAMCIECHRGPYFTDNMPRNTGVDDPKMDPGRGGTGEFFTAGLRNIAETHPYMHTGLLDTLGDVIWFYSQGGMKNGFTHPEDKDPLMQQFDITPDETVELDAFLRTLTGDAISQDLRTDTHVVRPTMANPMQCTMPDGTTTGLVCGGQCRDILNDPKNCGNCGVDCGTPYCMAGVCAAPLCQAGLQACITGCTDTQSDAANCGVCGHPCDSGDICMSGICTAPPPPTCPMPQTMCATGCTDLQTDPAHCGSCGNYCMTGQNCVAGACQQVACPIPQQLCNGGCKDFGTDPQNCGSCGNVCPANKPNCVMGACKQ